MSCKSDGFAFRLKSDATLMYPGLPSACCSSLDVRRMREFTGVEPATRNAGAFLQVGPCRERAVAQAGIARAVGGMLRGKFGAGPNEYG